MNFTVNGKPRHLDGQATIADYLRHLGVNPLAVAVELDGAIVKRDQFDATSLHEGARLEETLTFDAIDSRLQGHPDMTKLPGLDASTGSLGQGLSVGLGYALGAKLKKKDFHTFVILGDGEIQEGQIWEAAFVADRYHLDNLTAILDFNKIQQFGWVSTKPGETRRMHPSGTNPQDKFRAFGWNVLE